MTGAQRKRRWRADPANAAAENAARTARARGTTEQRLAESIRDTIRKTTKKLEESP